MFYSLKIYNVSHLQSILQKGLGYKDKIYYFYNPHSEGTSLLVLFSESTLYFVYCVLFKDCWHVQLKIQGSVLIGADNGKWTCISWAYCCCQVPTLPEGFPPLFSSSVVYDSIHPHPIFFLLYMSPKRSSDLTSTYISFTCPHNSYYHPFSSFPLLLYYYLLFFFQLLHPLQAEKHSIGIGMKFPFFDFLLDFKEEDTIYHLCRDTVQLQLKRNESYKLKMHILRKVQLICNKDV